MRFPFLKVVLSMASILLFTNALQAAGLANEPVARGMVVVEAASNPYGNDFDGDGISDFGVFDGNNGNWYVLSSTGSSLVWAEPWGWPGAIPVRGDYDGDGRGDLAVFDSNTGNWYVWSVANGLVTWATPWGWPGAIPVPGDYDGDARSDLAVFDSNTGSWYAWSLASGLLEWGRSWGWPGAVPVSGDYDGDARSDLAVFDVYAGNWYVWSLRNGLVVWASVWGWPGARPVSGDFDGDARSDLAAFDSITGHWYVTSLTNGTIAWGRLWGWPGAIPIGMPVYLIMSGNAELAVSAFPTNGGSVTGGGTYPVGLQVEITASAHTNWGFISWNDGNTQSVRTVAVPFGGAAYVASFVQQGATLTVSASPTNGGTVTGSGTYPVGTQVEITASANSGWVFSGWNDGNVQQIRTVTVPATGAVYVATFVQGGVITVSASPANGGTVTGGGTYAVGSQVQITAVANSGWTFSGWNDGNNQATRTVTVSIGGASYVASFTQGGTGRLTLTGHYATSGAKGVSLYGSAYACIADDTNGWFILNIVNPASPSMVSHTELAGNCNDIVVIGDYAYVSTSGNFNQGLIVYNISTPANPSEIQAISGQYNGLAVSGSTLYAGLNTPTFKVFNIDNSFALTQIGQYNSSSAGGRFALYGNYAYVATYAANILVLDVSTPAYPSLATTYATGNAAWDVAISGSTMCVAAGSNGMEVVDISIPFSPLRIGHYYYAGISSKCVAMSGTRCYLGSPDGSSRMLEIVDVSIPAFPTRMDHVTTGGYARDLVVSGQYLYVAEGSAGSTSAGLTIYRIE